MAGLNIQGLIDIGNVLTSLADDDYILVFPSSNVNVAYIIKKSDLGLGSGGGGGLSDFTAYTPTFSFFNSSITSAGLYREVESNWLEVFVNAEFTATVSHFLFFKFTLPTGYNFDSTYHFNPCLVGRGTVLHSGNMYNLAAYVTSEVDKLNLSAQNGNNFPTSQSMGVVGSPFQSGDKIYVRSLIKYL